MKKVITGDLQSYSTHAKRVTFNTAKGRPKKNRNHKKKHKRNKRRRLRQSKRNINRTVDATTGRELRVGSINVNGATREGILIAEAIFRAAEDAELDILLIQDTRATIGDLRGLQYRLNMMSNGGRSIRVIGSSQELDDKMLMVGGTAIVLFGRTARYLQEWGTDISTGTGMVTWARLRNRGDSIIVVSAYAPIDDGARDVREERHTLAARARRRLELLASQRNREEGCRTHGTKNPITWVMDEIDHVCKAEFSSRGRAQLDYLIGGDFNMKHNDKRLSNLRQRVGGVYDKLDERELWTFGKNKDPQFRSKPDHIFSTCGMHNWSIYEGELQDVISDHRMLKGSMKGSEGWGSTQFNEAPLVHDRIDIKVTRLSEETDSYETRQTQPKESKNSEMDKFVRHLTKLAKERARAEGERLEDYLVRLHKLIVQAATEATAYKKRKNGRKSRYKDGWSPTFLTLKAWLETLYKCRRALQNGKYWLTDTTTHIMEWREYTQAFERDQDMVRTLDYIADSQILTETDHHKMSNIIDDQISDIKKRLHGRERTERRKQMNEYVKKIEDQRKRGQIAQSLNMTLERAQKTQMVMVTDKDGNNVTDPIQLHHTLHKTFQKWFGESEAPWAAQLEQEYSPPRKPQLTVYSMDDCELRDTLHKAWIDAPVDELLKDKIIEGMVKRKAVWTDEQTRATSIDVSWEEWTEFIQQKPTDKAAGFSGLSFNMLKALPEDWGRLLYDTVRECVLGGKAPAMWLNVLLTPIPKDPTNITVDKLRPIQLLETTRKIWIGVLWKKVMVTIEHNKTLNPSQYGFRKGRETTQPIMQLLADIEEAHELQQPLYILLPDLKRCFDYFPRVAGMQVALRRHGVPEEVARLICDINGEGTCIHVRTGWWSEQQRNGITEKGIHSKTGVPQGSIEAPGLFIMYADVLADIIDGIQAEERDTVMNAARRQKRFADDENFSATGANGLTKMADLADAFYCLSGMEVNADKTILVAVNEREEDTPILAGIGKTKTDGTKQAFRKVEAGHEFRYLGIHSDDKASNKHAQGRIQGIIDITEGKLRRKRATLDAVWTALRTVVYPQIIYAAKFFSWEKDTLDKWDNQVARILRRAAHKPRTFPAALIYSPLGVGGTGITRLSDVILRESTLLQLEGLNNPHKDNGATLDRSKETNTWSRGIKTWLSGKIGAELKDTTAILISKEGEETAATYRKIAELRDELRGIVQTDGALTAYTDGSIRRTPEAQVISGLLHPKEDPINTLVSAAVVWTGSEKTVAAYVAFDEDQRRSASSTTVENAAIAAEAFIRENITDQIKIFSDSKGAINQSQRLKLHLNKGKLNTITTKTPNSALWQHIAREGYHIADDLEWIKGHIERRKKDKATWTTDEYGNWLADRIAGDERIDTIDMNRYRFTYEEITTLLAAKERHGSHRTYGLYMNGNDKEVSVTEPLRKWLTVEALEHEWELYTKTRDKNTSKRRKWQHVSWLTTGEAFRRANGKATLHGTLTALAWRMDWAPTGEKKEQRGYQADHNCSCNQQAPSKKHILTQCKAVINATWFKEWTDQWEEILVSELGAAMKAELYRWIKFTEEHAIDMSRSRIHLQAHLTEDLLSGIWSGKMLETLAGGIQARTQGEELSDGESIQNPSTMFRTETSDDDSSDTESEEDSQTTEEEEPAKYSRSALDALRREMVKLTAESYKRGLEIWRGDYRRRAERHRQKRAQDRQDRGATRTQRDRERRGRLQFRKQCTAAGRRHRDTTIEEQKTEAKRTQNHQGRNTQGAPKRRKLRRAKDKAKGQLSITKFLQRDEHVG